MSTQDNKDKGAAMRKGRWKKNLEELGKWDESYADLPEERLKEMLDEAKEAKRLADEASAEAPKTPEIPMPAQAQAVGFTPEQMAILGEMIGRGMAMANRENEKKEIKPDSRGYFNPDLIDPKDRLETPEYFFCPRFMHIIAFTMRTGVPTPPPYGKILHFTPDFWERDPHVGIKYTSKLRVDSRRQLEWLLGHEEYGIQWFKSSNEARSANAERTAIASNHARTLATKAYPELARMAHANGLKFSPDMPTGELRLRLVEVLTDATLRDDKARIDRMIENAAKQRHLLDEQLEGVKLPDSAKADYKSLRG